MGGIEGETMNFNPIYSLLEGVEEKIKSGEEDCVVRNLYEIASYLSACVEELTDIVAQMKEFQVEE
jgi:hypothetical protein